MQADLRSACGTGIGLGMKSPVIGVIVFGLTGRTHLKVPHRGLGAVIGNIIDNGVARPAVGAIDKRVTIAPICGVKKLPEAVFAYGNIR